MSATTNAIIDAATMTATANTVIDASTMTADTVTEPESGINIATADIATVGAMIKDFRAQIRSLNAEIDDVYAQKTTIIKKFNRNLETIKTLRADNTTLRAEKAVMEQEREALPAIFGVTAGSMINDGLADMAVSTANNGCDEGGAGDDMPQNVRRVTIKNVLRHFFRKVWESWGTNPHQAPAAIFGLGVFILVLWIFGGFAIAYWESLSAGEVWLLALSKGMVGTLPALHQFMMLHFPPVRARF